QPQLSPPHGALHLRPSAAARCPAARRGVPPTLRRSLLPNQPTHTDFHTLSLHDALPISFKANALVQGVPRHQQRRSRRGADIERCTIRQLRCALSERCETCALSEPCETCCALNERRGGECIRPSRPQSRSRSFISWITEARSHCVLLSNRILR